MTDSTRPAAGLVFVTRSMTIVVQDVNNVPTFSLLQVYPAL